MNAARFAGSLLPAAKPAGPARAGPFSWALALGLQLLCWSWLTAWMAPTAVRAATPSPAPPNEVRGRVVLPPESGWPAGALLVIELRETGSDRVWAELRLPLDRLATEQAFHLHWRRESLPFEPELRLRAALLGRGRALWLSAPRDIDPLSRDVDLGRLSLVRAPPPLAFQTEIDCRVRRFVVGMDGNQLVLRDGETTYPLRHDAEPPGPRHVAIDDPGTFVQTEGTTADVSVRGVRYALCSLSR